MSQTYTSNDFNDIMDSLVLFMRNQDEFRDMNFDGSAIRELLRVLAFNAQQQAFQNNFVYNELQLDTAQLRQNVASIASRLGYTPSSKTAAKMKVNLTVTPADPDTAPASLVLDRNTQFYATKDGQTYIFSADDAYSTALAGGKYLFTNVTLLQGIWAINGFMVQTQYGTESYVIPNGDVDTSTLEIAVRVAETSATQDTYTQYQTAYDLGPEAQLFFLRENRDGLYEFKFGDNKFSKRLDYGNVITARYLVTSGSAGNSITGLSPVASIGGFYDITIDQVDTRSYGGADQESIDSIRSLAPIAFAASGNAVTPGDYVGLAKRLFAETSDAICWGGEDNIPPRYGYVFLSVIPKNSDVLTDEQKEALVAILKKYNVGSVTPVIVDPVYTYVNVNSTVKYRTSALTISTDALKAKVGDYCRAFSKDKMEKFGGSLEMSNLGDFINSIDTAITGNNTQVSYEKRFVPTLNVSGSYVLPFSHKLEPGTVNITGFKVADTDSSGYIYSMYDEDGVLKLKKTHATVVGLTKILYSDVGRVDYDTGLVTVSNFKPNLLTDVYITVSASCSLADDQSLVGVKNSILKFNTINVTPLAVKK
jgi:hypothetical protein